jgi:ubiquinone biosynthesis protein UbiJ
MGWPWIVTPFPTRLMVQLANPPQVLKLSPDHEGETPVAQLTVRGTPGAFLAQLRSNDRRGLQLEGDTVLAARLMQAAQELAIDWDRLLAPYLGAELVNGGRQVMRGALSGFNKIKDSLLADASDYLHHEARWLPTRTRLETWLTDTESARQMLDRLEARLRRLEHKHTADKDDSASSDSSVR